MTERPAGLERRRILVVDDEPGIRTLFSFMLGAKGYDVHTAASGEEALESIQVGAYDLVFLDIRMPSMDGVLALRALRALRPDIPVVMMTGYAVEQLLSEAMREGASGYVRKPFTVEELLGSIAKALPRA